MVSRLLELRSSLDPALARGDEASARAQIEAVLDDFGDYIATGDLPTHRAFLTSFVAKRATEEAGVSAALSTLVAIGDTAVQVVQERLLTGHGEELALLVARVTAGSVRIVNDLVAEELARHKALSHELRTGHRAAQRGEVLSASVWGTASFTRPESRTEPIARTASADASDDGAPARGAPGDGRGATPALDDGELATELVPALRTLPGAQDDSDGVPREERTE